MELVLVEDRYKDQLLVRMGGALDEMKRNINICNKLIRELIKPIMGNTKRIKVHDDYSNYRNLQYLRETLEEEKKPSNAFTNSNNP